MNEDNHPNIAYTAAKGEDAEAPRKKEEPPNERRIRLLKQLGIVCLASLGHFSLGVTLPWPSPALSDIATNNGTLVGTQIVLSTLQKDMTGSMVSLGMLFGAWTAGWLVSSLGRKRSMQINVAPFLIGWILNALAPNPEVLLAARFILGLACGAVSVAGTAYILELADASVRGMMGTMTTVAIVVGGLYTVWMGYILQWHHLALVCAIPPAILLFVTFILPESPSYLVIRGRRQQALKILKKLRGPYANVEQEVQDVERRNLTNINAGNVGWSGLLKVDVMKRVAVMVMVFLFQQMCGNYVFMIQTSRVLEASGAPWDPDLATVVVGAVRVAGTLVAILLLDRVGRRYCLIASHAINSMALIILGVYVFLAEGASPDDETYTNLSWVPLLCVFVIMFFINVGVHPVPFILATEYFPTSIRAQAASISFSSGTVFAFLTLQLYSPMMLTMTQAGLYWFYASVSFVGVIFTVIFVEETKGKIVG